MSEDTENINVGCACDDNYAQHAGVMLYSLLENCSSPRKVKIFLVDSKISPENKRRLKSIVNKFEAKINFITADFSMMGNLESYRHFSKEMYLRFF